MAEVQIDIVAVDNFSGILGNFGNIMTGIYSTVNLVKQAFDTLVAPVINFGTEAAMTAARVDELAIVNSILASNAGIATETIPPLVEAIRGQGIEAGVAQTLVASMIRANLDLASATDLARIAQDAAVISGKNSSETLDNIIYGITTLSPLVLRHAGIVVDLQMGYEAWAEANNRSTDSLTTAEKQMIAFNLVMAEGEKLTGSYAAAMENAYKQTGSFERYINDVQVAIGEKLQPALNDVVFSLADFLKEIGKAVEPGGSLEGLVNLVAAIAESLTGQFAASVDAFLEGSGGGFLGWIQDLIDRSTEVEQVLVGVKDAIGGVQEGTGEEFGAVYELVPTIDLDLFVENLKNDIPILMQAFADEINAWVDSGGAARLSEGVINWINDLPVRSEFLEAVGKAALNIGEALFSALEAVDWEGIGSALDAKLAEVVRSVDWFETGQAFDESLGAAWDRFVAGQEGTFDWTRLIPTLYYGREVLNSEFAAAAGEAASSFISGMFSWLEPIKESIANWFIEIGANISDWWESVRTSFAEVVAGIGEFAAQVVTAIQDFVSGTVDNIFDWLGIDKDSFLAQWSEIFTGISEIAVAVFGIIGDAISDLWNALVARLATVFSNIYSQVVGALNSVKDGLVNAWNSVVDALTPVFQSLKDTILPLWDSIWNPVSETVTSVFDSVKSAIQSALTVVGGLVYGFYYIGKNIIQGMIDGIGDVAGTLIQTITDKIQEFIIGVKDKLGIHSASTVFFEIGKNVVQGLIDGIKSLIGGVLAILLEPFQPILDFLGIDLGNIGSTTGSGLDGWGNPIGGGTGGTATLGSTVTNNYNFYGTVYMSGVGPEGTYDCTTPPLMTSAQGSLYAPGY